MIDVNTERAMITRLDPEERQYCETLLKEIEQLQAERIKSESWVNYHNMGVAVVEYEQKTINLKAELAAIKAKIQQRPICPDCRDQCLEKAKE